MARMRDRRGTYLILVGRPDGKGPRGRPRHRREDNIAMDLKEMVWGSMGWIALTHDRYSWRAVVNAVTKLQVSVTYVLLWCPFENNVLRNNMTVMKL